MKGRCRREIFEDEAQQRAIRWSKLREAGEALRAVRDAMKAEGFELSYFGVQKIVEAASAQSGVPPSARGAHALFRRRPHSAHCDLSASHPAAQCDDERVWLRPMLCSPPR